MLEQPQLTKNVERKQASDLRSGQHCSPNPPSRTHPGRKLKEDVRADVLEFVLKIRRMPGRW